MLYTEQAGVCADGACPKKGHVFKFDEMHADHINLWHAGGKSVRLNCQMLCQSCNLRKGGG